VNDLTQRTVNGFPKEERLRGKPLFEEITSKGSSFFSHPFRIIWMKTDDRQTVPVRVAFGVPKRNFKSAVKRNRIKRLMRESYRLNKQDLHDALGLKSVKIVVFIVYTGKDVPSFTETQGKIILSLRRLLNAIDAAGTLPQHN
jgi:ribonuclease P protein component